MQQEPPMETSYRSRAGRVLRQPAVIAFCLYGVIAAWVVALGGGYLFAQLDPAGPGTDPAGYSLLVNYISDLGSLRYTPLPKLLDDGLMLTGIFMVPTALYLRRILSPAGNRNRFRKILSYIILGLYLVGSFGIFFTGVISEDVGEVWDAIFGMPFPDYPWHDLAADIAFYSFIGNGFLIVLLLELYPSILEQQMGVARRGSLIIRILLGIDVAVLCPLFFAIFWSSYPDLVVYGMFSSFWEWMLVLSYTAWQLPLCVLLIRAIKSSPEPPGAGRGAVGLRQTAHRSGSGG